MTMHVVYNHECVECQAFYIPYDEVPCPKCGTLERERFDYIPQAVASLQVNKRSTGFYTPGAWWVGSLGDHILSLLFRLMDGYADQPPSMDFAFYLDDRLDNTAWGDQQYMKAHLRGIALRVHEQLARGKMWEPDAYVNYAAAQPDAPTQASEQRRREQQQLQSDTQWGEAVCTECGRKLRTWADDAQNRCGYCHHALPAED